MPLNSQLGVKAETTVGTPVTVDRFFEYESEGIEPELGTWEPALLRASQRVRRADRFARWVGGYAGSLRVPVLTAGWGWWLEHLLGAVATGTVGADGEYDHTGTIASLSGTSFTAQVNRPLTALESSAQAFTYAGGKVASWVLECDVEAGAMLEAQCLFMSGTTATALASASYPAGAELMAWPKAELTLEGTGVPVRAFRLECNNGLNDGRYDLRNSAARREPNEQAARQITVSFTADFDNLTDFYNRLLDGDTAEVEFVIEGPTAIGGTTYPSLTATMPAVRFDGGPPTVGGEGTTELSVTGMALNSAGSDDALELVYVSADTTP